MSEPTREPDLKAVEAAMLSLTPTSSINRDALLFRAGQASVRRQWLWPVATGLLAGVAVLLAVGWMSWPRQGLHEVHLVAFDVPSKPHVATNQSSATPSHREGDSLAIVGHPNGLREYQRLQDQLVRWGLDAVPSPPRLVADTVTSPHIRPKDATPKAADLRWYQFMFDSGERL